MKLVQIHKKLLQLFWGKNQNASPKKVIFVERGKLIGWKSPISSCTRFLYQPCPDAFPIILIHSTSTKYLIYAYLCEYKKEA